MGKSRKSSKQNSSQDKESGAATENGDLQSEKAKQAGDEFCKNLVSYRNSLEKYLLKQKCYKITYYTKENKEAQEEIVSILCSFVVRLTTKDLMQASMLSRLGPNINFIAYPSEEENLARMRESENISEELKKSYYTMEFLTTKEPSDEYSTFYREQQKRILSAVFCVFQTNSRGYIRQACCIIHYFMRFSMSVVHQVIGSSLEDVKRYMGGMLNYLEHSGVSDLFVLAISEPLNSQCRRHTYEYKPAEKWTFFEQLSKWKVLQVLADRAHSTSYSEAHSIVAADTFIELINRLAVDENSQILLQPLAHCPDILENFIDAAMESSGTRSRGQRTAAMRCVLHILQTCAFDRVPAPTEFITLQGSEKKYVPNQLATLRDVIYHLAEKQVPKFLKFLLNTYPGTAQMKSNSDKALPDTAVRYASFTLKAPFTVLRLLIVNTLLQIVLHNPVILAGYFDIQVWNMLMNWFFAYEHNNLYHGIFTQLVFITVRFDHLQPLNILIKKLKLVSHLIDHYQNDDASLSSNKAYILQCCNILRLQAAAQAPDAELRKYLHSHGRWKQFQPELREKTKRTCMNGMGFKIPELVGYPARLNFVVINEVDIDHGSAYAKSLGFIDDVAWPDEEASSKKKKKRKNKRKNKKGPLALCVDRDDPMLAVVP